MEKFMIAILFVVISFVSSATLISNDIPSHENDDKITSLPGYSDDITFNQYSGYLDGGNNIRLHYWFVESQNDPAKDPVLLWLNGGPGCSSMDGMLNELGPFHVNNDGETLYKNDFSWNLFSSVLFLESPACVGFSYQINNSDNCVFSDNSTSLANYNAIKNFFIRYPEFRQNEFFVTGESYGGIYVPTLTLRIAEGQKDFPINLKGFAVGNGLSSWAMNDDSLIFFANYHGLLGKNLWQSLVSQCCASDIPTQQNCNFSNSRLPSCLTLVNKVNQIINDGLNIYNLYDTCVYPSTNETISFTRYHADKKLLHRNALNFVGAKPLQLDPPCTDSSAMSDYLNSKDVRQALHIPDSVGTWDICNDEVNANFITQYSSMDEVYKQIKSHGIRGLVYNGDVDMACNFIGDQWFVEGLNYKETEVRKPWFDNKQVGGYVKRFDMLDLLTVRGSGHMVPQDKPSPSLKMIKAFVFNTAY